MPRHRPSWTVVVVLPLLPFLGVHATQIEPQTQQGLSATYQAGSSRFVLNEPVMLTFELRNNSEDLAQIDLGTDRKGSFLITIARPDGTQVRLPRFSKNGFARVGVVTVEPGGMYTQRLLLNEWFQFGEQGKYEVEVILTQPVIIAQRSIATQVSPFRASFEILARDPARLKEICGRLVRQIYAAPDYEAAAEAALALSYIQDPIAVPCLESALYAGRMVEAFAIHGLRRIGNSDAIKVLLATVGNVPPNERTSVQSMAASALEILALETKDPALKRTITTALDTTKKKEP